MQTIGASVYFDDKQNVIIIPTLRKKNGLGYSSMKFIKIKNNFTIEELSISIMEALKTSLLNEQEEHEKIYVWTEASGIKSFPAFSKK